MLDRRMQFFGRWGFLLIVAQLLSALGLAAPSNHLVEDAIFLASSLPLTLEVDTSSASLEPFEPRTPDLDSVDYPSGSMWYRWTSPVNDTVSVQAGSPNDLVGVAVFLGSAVERLITTTDGESVQPWVYQFPAVQGKTYTICLYALNGGDATLHLASSASLAPADDRQTPRGLPSTLPAHATGSMCNATETPG
ncbi:MAG: hypothetical protein ACI8XO_004855, partial [Verrucomicrobiales bacterium]